MKARTKDSAAAIAFALLCLFHPAPAASHAGQSASSSAAAPSAATPPQSAPKTKPILPPESRVDINHASIDELIKVPGLTPAWAGRIVRFRPYRTKQDLLERGVVPSDVYDRIKDYVIAHRDKQ